MTTRIMIDQCHADRDRVTSMTEAEIEALAISIRDGTMKHPILVLPNVDGSYIVVDGLARIAAASKLGLLTIEAVVTQDIEQACRLLERAHANQKVPPRRIWEVTQALECLFHRRRRETQRRHREGDMTELPLPSTLLTKAFGLRSSNDLKVLRSVYRMAGTTGNTEILSRFEEGEFTPAMALGRYRLLASGKQAVFPPVRKPDPSVHKSEQLTLLVNASRNLGITLKAIADESVLNRVSPEDLEPIIGDLRKHRASLARLIHSMEKEVSGV